MFIYTGKMSLVKMLVTATVAVPTMASQFLIKAGK